MFWYVLKHYISHIMLMLIYYKIRKHIHGNSKNIIVFVRVLTCVHNNGKKEMAQISIIPPPQRSLVGYIGFWFYPVCVFVCLSVSPYVCLPVCLSVCLSICLSPSMDMIFSAHVLRNGCMEFSENAHWLLTVWRCAPRIFLMIG